MGAGSTVRELLLPVRMGQGPGSARGGVGAQRGERALGEGRPGYPVSEVEENLAAGAGQRGGDGTPFAPGLGVGL